MYTGQAEGVQYCTPSACNGHSQHVLHKRRFPKFKVQAEGELLRGVSFIVRAGNDIIKADFKHTMRTTFPTEMKIGIHIEELK